MVDKHRSLCEFTGNCKKLYPQYIAMKRALGYKYESEERLLAGFDRFLLENFSNLSDNEIPREAIELWETRRPHETPKTHSSRMLIVRKFCEYAAEHGFGVFISLEKCNYKSSIEFVPHIYTDDELKRFFNTVDNHHYKTVLMASPLFYPTFFRILYCCGLRLTEALNLCVKDIDFETATLNIRNTKFGKDRTVPFGDDLLVALKKYFFTSHHSKPEDYFFTSPYGGRYNGKTVGNMFRKLLEEAGITHCGRNKGPRIHDFRHTFSVTCLKNWLNSGAEIQVKLPILSAYLGHADLRGTQRYLRLTSQMYPCITELFDSKFGYLIQTGGISK